MAEESDVGILCYTTDAPGFKGVLKQRYTDFIVNEVDSEGKVIRLTCLDASEEVTDASQMKLTNDASGEEALEHSDMVSNETYDAQILAFKSLAGEAEAEKLKEFLAKFYERDLDNLNPIILAPDSDKGHRAEIHNFFKVNFKFLVTDTIDGIEPNSKCIRIHHVGKDEQGRGRGNNRLSGKKRKNRGRKQDHELRVDISQAFDSRGAESWPDGKRFLRFHLYKENKDTHEALNVIAKMLHVKPKSFGTAGTKDKRAVTTQQVTVFKQHASRVAALNKRLIGIKVGDFCYVSEGLKLGQLSGNRFNITLRGVVAETDNVIEAAAEKLGKNGFVNYFGLQRFGSGSVATHAIGAALLQGEWKSAVDLILDPRDGERSDVKKAREYYKNSKDIDGALKRLPQHLLAEKSVLTGLKRCPGNYLQAMSNIPRNLRLMYVHSYQSYLWNHAASARIKKYGVNNIVIGDLVYCKEIDSERNTIQKPQNGGDDDSECKLDSIDDDSEYDYSQENYFHVKVVNADDIESGKYTIEDVLLPLPGSKIMYPANDIADVYHEIAGKDSVNLCESSHNVKEYSIMNLPGGYRRLIQKPIDFTWKIVKYADPTQPLAETDLEMITKLHREHDSCDNPHAGADKLGHDDNSQAEHIQKSKFSEPAVSELDTALKLTFTLPTSCYATMAIRELLKTSTSTNYHKNLND